jgi:hypothetical protein
MPPFQYDSLFPSLLHSKLRDIFCFYLQVAMLGCYIKLTLGMKGTYLFMELSSIGGEEEVAEAIAIEGVARKSHSTQEHGHHGGVERELPGAGASQGLPETTNTETLTLAGHRGHA